MSRCPKVLEQRHLESLSFWSRGINAGESLGLEASAQPTLGSLAERDALAERVRRAHTAARGSLLAHSAARGVPPSPDLLGVNEAERERHRVQRQAIGNLLARQGLLGKGHCLVELGAGNGQLTLEIVNAWPEVAERDAVLLIDQYKPRGRKASGRKAADGELADRCSSFRRIRMDLEDLDLARLREEIAPTRKLVVYASPESSPAPREHSSLWQNRLALVPAHHAGSQSTFLIWQVRKAPVRLCHRLCTSLRRARR